MSTAIKEIESPANAGPQDPNFAQWAQGQVAAMMVKLGPKFAAYLKSLADMQKSMLQSYMDYSNSQATSHKFQGYCEALMSAAGAAGSGLTAYGSSSAINEFNQAEREVVKESSALDGSTLQVKNNSETIVQMQQVEDETEMQPMGKSSAEIETKPADLKDADATRNALKEQEKTAVANSKLAHETKMKTIDMNYQRTASIGNIGSQLAQVATNGAKADLSSKMDLQSAAASLVNQQASMANEAFNGTLKAWEGTLGSIARLMGYGESLVRA
jgi:hypothetical protein